MLLEFVSLVKTAINMLVAILFRLIIQNSVVVVHNYYVSGHPVEATPTGLFGNVGRPVM